jgi:hypothetical protein
MTMQRKYQVFTYASQTVKTSTGRPEGRYCLIVEGFEELDEASRVGRFLTPEDASDPTTRMVVTPMDSMNQAAVNRWDDAVGIQGGACNMSGVTRALVRCINQCREENGDVRTDAAIRMIVHQMAHLCNVDEINTGFDTYSKLAQECEEKSTARKAELKAAKEAAAK